ncbi:MAG TPA: hypothetical protein VGG57_04755 [Stellaceae bacterium]|jgi:hypothetical protein
MRNREADRHRNRRLGVILAATAATIFVTVFAMVVLVRYAEIHHLLAAV